MNSVNLSVVVPAYNEEKNLRSGRLINMLKWLDEQKFSKEVILVDDGSTDNTADLVAKKLKKFTFARVIRNRHHGKAYTVKTGILKSEGDLVLFTDFDQSTPIQEVEKLMAKIRAGFDVVIGSREGKGAKREAEPILRHLMGRVFNFLVRLLVIGDFADTQCGFKLFKHNTAREIFKRLKHYDQQKPKTASVGAFDVEVLYLAKKFGYKIAEIPVYWRHYETERVSALRDSVKMGLELLKIRIRDIFGYYD
jgi:dolichyl-phosphate beta-glucosyltransferase